MSPIFRPTCIGRCCLTIVMVTAVDCWRQCERSSDVVWHMTDEQLVCQEAKTQNSDVKSVIQVVINIQSIEKMSRVFSEHLA